MLSSEGAGLVQSSRNRAENKRRQALSNKYSQKYPLSDDANRMNILISQAQNELLNIRNTPISAAAAKRVKKREDELLSKWITTMQAHSRDLQSGLTVAVSETAAEVLPIREKPKELVIERATEAKILEKIDSAAQTPISASQTGVAAVIAQEGGVLGALPVEEQRKKINWLLLGGIAVGAILLYKFIKK